MRAVCTARELPAALEECEEETPDEVVLLLPDSLLLAKEASAGLRARRWRRVILDEAHKMQGGQNGVRSLLSALRAEVVWGLTGTPNLSSGTRVMQLAELLRVFVPPDQWRECQQFLDVFVRADKWDKTQVPPVRSHEVPVRLTLAERALYRGRLALLPRSSSSFSSDGSRRVPPEELQPMLQLCSHFSPEDLGSVPTCEAAVLRTVRQHREELRNLEAVEQILMAQVPEYEVSPGVANRYRNLEEVRARRGRLESALSYLEKVIQAVAAQEEEGQGRTPSAGEEEGPGRLRPQCPICQGSAGEEIAREALVVTACGHLFCEECIMGLLRRGGRACPTCRAAISNEKIDSVIALENPEAIRFGTKLLRMAAEIRRIHEEDRGGKIIVWVQWDALAAKVRKALEEIHGVRCLGLGGPIAARQQALADFEDSNSDYVLLLAFENDDSGLNLICANHVVFLHPVALRDPEAARACERQAVGRCRRFGQEKEVHVYRFFAQFTVEEELVRERLLADAENLAA